MRTQVAMGMCLILLYCLSLYINASVKSNDSIVDAINLILVSINSIDHFSQEIQGKFGHLINEKSKYSCKMQVYMVILFLFLSLSHFLF